MGVLSGLFCLLCLSLCLLSAPVGQAKAWADWPSFHGGSTRGGARPHLPGLQDPRIRWQQRVGLQNWLNNPLIVGQTVFVGCDTPDEGWGHTEQAGVLALDLSNGHVRWRITHSDAVNGISYADGLLLVSLEAGELQALEAQTGQLKWRYRPIITDSLGEKNSRYARLLDTENKPSFFAGAVVLNDVVVAATRHGHLVGLDLTTGQVRWTHRRTGAIRNGLSADAHRIYVATTTGELLALSAAGQILWQRTLETNYPVHLGRTDSYPLELYAAPLIRENQLILSLARRHRSDTPAVRAIDPQTGRDLWQARDLHSGDQDYPNLRSTPTVAGELLVLAEPLGNRVLGLEARTGQVRWRKEIGVPLPFHWSSGASAGNTVYLPRSDGSLYALEASTGALRWQFYLGHASLLGTTPPAGIGLSWRRGLPSIGDAIYASPALAEDGTLVVSGGDGWIYALEESP
ncbi:MAG: PQQ-binding-like beta-propeller repeat protein [Candidatus Sericytochromatia bacterium]